ncbi:MAG: hypothetical protein H6709_14445 [Kofleriaceae bacterium]|nr:hypothetical protein [Kofleriaceae bacterium]MCB9573277.1 hypothetical protein [Kofleriaceae bacterium]
MIAAWTLAVVASAMVPDGGVAIGLDDGSVWLVWDGEWDELGQCDDGDVAAVTDDGDGLVVRCGDGTTWTWSLDGGWLPDDAAAAADAGVAAMLERPWTARWLPDLELLLRRTDAADRAPVLEGWVHLRWSL